MRFVGNKLKNIMLAAVLRNYAVLLLCVHCLCANANVGMERESSALGPYWAKIDVDVPEKGEYELSLDKNLILKRLGDVTGHRFASFGFPYEGVRVVDMAGQNIGEFQYELAGENILKDSGFSTENQPDSPWGRLTQEGNSISAEKNIGTVLWTQRSRIENTPVYQVVNLKRDSDYLMEADTFSDVQVGGAGIRLYRAEGGVFAQMPDSYMIPLAPQGKWIKQRRFVHAVEPVGHLRLNNVIIGRCGIANPSLKRVEWKLTVNFANPGKQTIYLDICPHRGLEMTSPDSVKLRTSTKPLPIIVPDSMENFQVVVSEDVFSAEADSGKTVIWSLDAASPLETSLLAKSVPVKKSPDVPVRLICAKGEKRVALLGISCEGDQFKLTEQKLEGLPPEISLDLRRLAGINIYEDWTQRKRLQRRLDPMVEVNDPLVKMEDSPAALCVTVNVPDNVPAGKYSGKLLMTLDAAPSGKASFTVPLELEVLPIMSRPMEHFRVNFAGQLLCVKNALGQPSTSVAEFHGYSVSELSDRPKMRKLYEAYLDSMLDFCVQPMSLMGFVPLTVNHKLMPDGTVTLDGWDFSEWDKVLDEYVTRHGATFINLMHTNGINCSRFSITTAKGWQGFTCEAKTPAGYTRLSKKAFDALIGDYFDAIAMHLDKKGMLDNAYICFDESPTDTYQKVRDFGFALKGRPYAKRIKIYHTLQHTAFYTKMVDGKNKSPLMLQEIFDIVAPEMDDANNYYAPSNWANGRGSGPDPTTWVYYVDTERLRIDTAGLSTLLTPMQLETYGVNGFHHWVLRLWDLPYKPVNNKLPNGFAVGPSKNPWVNPHYHHGPGLLSFYYPPDPRGVSATPTNKVIPSYRLALLREGIQDRALLEMLKAGHDDAGKPLKISSHDVQELRDELSRLWLNPVQWKLDLPAYRKWKNALHTALRKAANSTEKEK